MSPGLAAIHSSPDATALLTLRIYPLVAAAVIITGVSFADAPSRSPFAAKTVVRRTVESTSSVTEPPEPPPSRPSPATIVVIADADVKTTQVVPLQAYILLSTV